MNMKLFFIIISLSYTLLLSYEISIDSFSSKKVQEKKEKKHIFKRDSTKEVVLDSSSYLMWQDNLSVKTLKRGLKDAKEYCYKLKLSNYTDWRLPSIEELKSIADITTKSPAINKAFKNVKSDFYISASPRLSDIDTIMYMDFKNGHKYEASRRGKGYVRCVRVDKKR